MTLGKTGITVPQNAFGALPIQRDTKEEAVRLLRMAYTGGMRFFDTARIYTDSEEKLGLAFGDGWLRREDIFIASKTKSDTPECFWKDLETSLKLLKTDYLDIYQFHCAGQCFAPGDGTGLYECMLEAKAKGLIRHIGITAHKLDIAIEAAESGLYETIQFPFSYLSSEKDIALVRLCEEKGIGFIAMKGLAGGLITHAQAAMAYMTQFPNVLPIWGVQRESELLDWLSFFAEGNSPVMSPEIRAFIEGERAALSGDFCRGCGYCMPCPAGITINQCARIGLMIRRAPSEKWLSSEWQAEMEKIENCINCRQCTKKCPYELDTPALLRKNLADYRRVIRGEITV